MLGLLLRKKRSDDSDSIRTLRHRFDRDGFLLLKGFYDADHIDSVQESIDRQLAADPHVVVDDLKSGRRIFWANRSNAGHYRFKFNDLYLANPQIRDLAASPRLGRLAGTLLKDRPVIVNSLYFQQGSTQDAHIDSLYMTPRTPLSLVASWIALEDVDADAGPLFYYPGSHDIPLYRFRDGTYTANPEEMPQWSEYIRQELNTRGIERQSFLAQKGDVFIWHANLVHGGSLVHNIEKTRRSLVFHYYTAKDCRQEGWAANLRRKHRAYWLNRLPQPVKLDCLEDLPNGVFPEQQYLRRHPDVATAVARGDIASGEQHYRMFGLAEGRAI